MLQLWLNKDLDPQTLHWIQAQAYLILSLNMEVNLQLRTIKVRWMQELQLHQIRAGLMGGLLGFGGGLLGGMARGGTGFFRT